MPLPDSTMYLKQEALRNGKNLLLMKKIKKDYLERLLITGRNINSTM